MVFRSETAAAAAAWQQQQPTPYLLLWAGDMVTRHGGHLMHR
jgi:hypothetical protein